jgi:hypothetical protein
MPSRRTHPLLTNRAMQTAALGGLGVAAVGLMPVGGGLFLWPGYVAALGTCAAIGMIHLQSRASLPRPQLTAAHYWFPSVVVAGVFIPATILVWMAMAPSPPQPAPPKWTTLGDQIDQDPKAREAQARVSRLLDPPPQDEPLGMYFSEVGTAPSEAVARRELAGLRRRVPSALPYATWLLPTTDSPRRYRELMGVFLRQGDARTLCDAISRAGLPCSVISPSEVEQDDVTFLGA